ncbi:hypothetical protein C8R45DRAFT_1219078 [Mycena sanguinolenta]|nr:hypothetical protein C8R45DRAFT_1219078 [Mycena sanguinolenta]
MTHVAKRGPFTFFPPAVSTAAHFPSHDAAEAARFKSALLCAPSSFILLHPPPPSSATSDPPAGLARRPSHAVFALNDGRAMWVRFGRAVWVWCAPAVGEFVLRPQVLRPSHSRFTISSKRSQLNPARQLELRTAEHDRHHRRPAAFASVLDVC